MKRIVAQTVDQGVELFPVTSPVELRRFDNRDVRRVRTHRTITCKEHRNVNEFGHLHHKALGMNSNAASRRR
jgi:hypothetical protein